MHSWRLLFLIVRHSTHYRQMDRRSGFDYQCQMLVIDMSQQSYMCPMYEIRICWYIYDIFSELIIECKFASGFSVPYSSHYFPSSNKWHDISCNHNFLLVFFVHVCSLFSFCYFFVCEDLIHSFYTVSVACVIIFQILNCTCWRHESVLRLWKARFILLTLLTK